MKLRRRLGATVAGLSLATLGGLLGLAIESVTGEAYAAWVQREIVEASGLHETVPDVQALPRRARLAHGHSAKQPLGHRVAIDVGMSTHALAAATGGYLVSARLLGIRELGALLSLIGRSGRRSDGPPA